VAMYFLGRKPLRLERLPPPPRVFWRDCLKCAERRRVLRGQFRLALGVFEDVKLDKNWVTS
jgi:hypothetical protein